MEQIKTKTVISDTIDNWLVSTKGRDKNEQIFQLTKTLQPYLAMIFVNTKTRADDLHAYLVAQGLKVDEIHGDIPPRERKRIMNQVKNLDFEYIVATDLAARGIDIEGVSHVINDCYSTRSFLLRSPCWPDRPQWSTRCRYYSLSTE